jgi:hypothetical protein
MRVKRAAAGSASLFLLMLAARSAAVGSVPASPAPFDRTDAPPSYTFRLDVVMAMRHFPWFHFHLEGVGVYQPGVSYVVHFTNTPWFMPQARHDADLSMLDPAMWPRRYLYEEIGEQGDERLYVLHAINDQSLRSATVAIGPKGACRRVDATYSDGTHIETHVSASNVDGFFLPATMTADIDEPHIALSANADFKDYDFSFDRQARNATQ